MNEDIHWFSDEGRARAMGSTPAHRVYMLPAEFWRAKRPLPNPPHQAGQQAVRPLVHPAALQPPSSSTWDRWPVDIDRGRPEGIPENPRYRVGAMVQDPESIGAGRSVAPNKGIAQKAWARRALIWAAVIPLVMRLAGYVRSMGSDEIWALAIIAFATLVMIGFVYFNVKLDNP